MACRAIPQIASLRDAGDGSLRALSIEARQAIVLGGSPFNLRDEALRVGRLGTVVDHVVGVLAEGELRLLGEEVRLLGPEEVLRLLNDSLVRDDRVPELGHL